MSEQLRAFADGFDPAVDQARGLLAVIRRVRQLPRRGLPNETRLLQLRQVLDPATDAGGRQAAEFANGLVAAELQLRELRARLRFTRLAAMFHARLPVPALPDPFGNGDLVFQVAGERAVTRSVGEFAPHERLIERRAP